MKHSFDVHNNVSAEAALEKLVAGNKKYMDSLTNPGDISLARRID